MSKRHNEVLEHLAEIEKSQIKVAKYVEEMDDMSSMPIISTQLMLHTALLADINESLAIIADKMGGAE